MLKENTTAQMHNAIEHLTAPNLLLLRFLIAHILLLHLLILPSNIFHIVDMLIHVQITSFWLQRKLEQRKKKQAVNNMNKLKMFETRQVTPDLTKNLKKMPQYTYRTHQCR